MYCRTFEVFQREALRIFRESPAASRFCMVYTKQGDLRLKFTDDRQVVILYTRQLSDMKYLDKFLKEIGPCMCGVMPPAPTTAEA